MLKDHLDPPHVFIEDGSSPEIVAGTATIGLEILKQVENLDTLIVPVGNGALIGGIGTLVKDKNPDIKIIGIQAELASCMALSFKVGRPIDTKSCATFAGGMAVRVAIPEAVDLLLNVVDEMLLVSEDEMKRAMALYYRCTQEIVEGAGAAALAAALRYPEKMQNQTICLIATGANIDPQLKQDIFGNLN